MLKKTQVHMLPQERQTPRVNRILLHKTKNTLHYGVKATNDGMVALTQCSDDSLEWNGELIPHHLYFTTDELTQKGDWYIDTKTNTVKQHIAHTLEHRWNCIHNKKIVATTDPDLWDAIPLRVGSKSLSEINIAKIPTDFIEVFVREQGNIKEVQLEYEEKTTDVIEKELGIYGHDEGLTKSEYEAYRKQNSLQSLKLRNNGTVIIHKVKEKLYTQDELVAATIQLFDTDFVHTIKSRSALVNHIKEFYTKYFAE